MKTIANSIQIVAIFSAQEPPRGASAANRRSGRSRPEATGGGFRRGKQEPPRRRIQKEDGRKDSETSKPYLNTPTRDGRRIEAPLGGVPPPPLVLADPLQELLFWQVSDKFSSSSWQLAVLLNPWSAVIVAVALGTLTSKRRHVSGAPSILIRKRPHVSCASATA